MRDIENWLSEEELKSIYTSSYWNNIDEEKKKEWWIEGGDYKKCLNYLRSSKLLYEYEESEKFINLNSIRLRQRLPYRYMIKLR